MPKYVYSKTRPVLWRSIMSILGHAADSSAVLGVYTQTKKIWGPILRLSISSPSVLNLLCFSCCMFFFFCIEGEWNTDRLHVGDCYSVVVVCTFKAHTVNTDTGESHVTIHLIPVVMSDPSICHIFTFGLMSHLQLVSSAAFDTWKTAKGSHVMHLFKNIFRHFQTSIWWRLCLFECVEGQGPITGTGKTVWVIAH